MHRNTRMITCIGDASSVSSLFLAAILDRGVGKEDSNDCRRIAADPALLAVLAGVLLDLTLLLWGVNRSPPAVASF